MSITNNVLKSNNFIEFYTKNCNYFFSNKKKYYFYVKKTQSLFLLNKFYVNNKIFDIK